MTLYSVHNLEKYHSKCHRIFLSLLIFHFNVIIQIHDNPSFELIDLSGLLRIIDQFE